MLAEVKQRIAVDDLRVHHLAHQDVVIPHGHDPVDGALDGGQHARYQGTPVAPGCHATPSKRSCPLRANRSDSAR